MKDNMLEAEIWGVAQAGDGDMIFLRPLGSDSAVPIFIGRLETQAILIGIENISVPRPLTPDLLLTIAKSLGLALERAEITEIRDNTFIAGLVFSRTDGGEPLEADARPSDALSLAVRVKCPVFIAGAVFEEAGIPLSDLAEREDFPEDPEAEISSRLKALVAELDTAVAFEDYEKAARIRDTIKKIKNVD